MATPPFVSVIIPTFNRATYVTEAVDSVLAQTFCDYELIVVDDGSTDNTAVVLKHYEDNIRYLYQENRGVSAARNLGIQQARGQWICFLDSDDTWLPHKLQSHVDYIHRKSDVILHAVNIDLTRYGSVASTTFEHCNLNVEELLISSPFGFHLDHRFVFCPPAVMCLRSALLSVGLFDESLSLCEDYSLMCRLALEGSWAVTNRVGGYAIRREIDEVEGLSQARHVDLDKTFKSLITVHKLMLNDKRLGHVNSEKVRRLLNLDCRTYARKKWLVGDIQTAKRILHELGLGRSSLKTIFYRILAGLPAPLATPCFAWMDRPR